MKRPWKNFYKLVRKKKKKETQRKNGEKEEYMANKYMKIYPILLCNREN